MKTDNGIGTLWKVPAVKTFGGRGSENSMRGQQAVPFKTTLRYSRVSCYNVSLLEDTSGCVFQKHDDIKLLLLFLGPRLNSLRRPGSLNDCECS